MWQAQNNPGSGLWQTQNNPGSGLWQTQNNPGSGLWQVQNNPGSGLWQKNSWHVRNKVKMNYVRQRVIQTINEHIRVHTNSIQSL